MSALVDHVVARVITAQVRLLACQARLAAQTDSEALHDLRTSVRRLRSLLRPLRERPGIEQLEAAAKAVGDLTTPLRDKEVLAAQLLKMGQVEPAQRRLGEMAGVFPAVAASAELQQLLNVLDAFPGFLRVAQRQRLLRKLHPRLEKRLAKQWKQLVAALQDPAHDRHRLRLLIKRVRYAAEAYPQLDRATPALTRSLKRAQAALGDWHDHFQWLLQADTEADLSPCIARWSAAMHNAEERADGVLEKLLDACQAAKLA
ncbi:CHAD domain-containing protein [Pseudomonas sp. R5(2019)]|uniref:CHAD domain-containing protein n=1 Tax=Pseudomonas sp. R5(2019) TaxID=2697566 RepID=UPI0014129F98|nr:CHAD domain-containing protein [Pseudomonas sp. R5(2019)]NBA97323.1 CHAD domain-containing protein [Pseudomonas sp. R5(2019)]